MSASPDHDVLGFGAVAVDDLLYVDEYPPADGKVRVHHRLRQCGGLTGTALVAAARLGTRCGYAGVLGFDELSQFVAATLEQEGVDLAPSVRRPDARPAHSTIIVDQKHRTRTIFSSLGGAIGADPTLPDTELIAGARVLLIDHHGLEGTLRAVRIAGEHGVEVVADFERDPGPPFGQILELVHHLVVSEKFARRLLSRGNEPACKPNVEPTNVEEMPARLWSPARKAVVVTCGAAGGWYVTGPGQAAARYAGFDVDVVDTTGCGDVFHGAYAAGLAQRWSPAECIRWAAASAALKATRRGGQAGIPFRAHVEEFLAQR